MKYINELENILEQQIKMNKARIKCFAQILLSLFKVRTVILSEIAVRRLMKWTHPTFKLNN